MTLALVCIGLGTAANAIVVPPGTLPTQTWTASNSPYVITGDVTLPAGATLTIQGGVQVLFAPGDASHSGFDAARTEFNVSGTLALQATQAAPIVFGSQSNAGNDDWSGITFNTGAAAVNFSDTTFRNAYRGIVISGATPFQATRFALTNCYFGFQGGTGAVSLDSSTITNCIAGFNVTSGLPTISHTRVSGCGLGGGVGGPIGGIIATNSVNLTVVNCHFYNNPGAALNVTNGSLAHIDAYQCTINNNGTGISASGGSASIYNSILSFNDLGIGGAGNNTAAQSCNTFGNSSLGSSNFLFCISSAPGLTAADDPHLLPYSPCIDAANDGLSGWITDDLYGTPRPQDGNGDGVAHYDIGAVEFTCGTPLNITTPPQNTTATVGQPLVLTVAHTGVGLSYQWRWNGTNMINGRGVSGVTTNTLTIQSATPFDAGSYDVVVTGTCSTTTSAAATITVHQGCGSADFNADGDIGTDADIEAFFRVLAGGPC